MQKNCFQEDDEEGHKFISFFITVTCFTCPASTLLKLLYVCYVQMNYLDLTFLGLRSSWMSCWGVEPLLLFLFDPENNYEKITLLKKSMLAIAGDLFPKFLYFFHFYLTISPLIIIIMSVLAKYSVTLLGQ